MSSPIHPLSIPPIGVVGAGTMGAGLAQMLSEAGYQVVLVDISDKNLSAAKASVAHGVRLGSLLLRKSAVPVSEIIQRIILTSNYKLLAPCEIVIESVSEIWEVKRSAYREMDARCQRECIFLANTSCIPIARLAAETSRASRVIGVHFMNPAPLKDTVEVISSTATSPETLARTREFLASVGKRTIEVADAPGFVSNRVLMPMINDAIALFAGGAASAQDIDRIFTACLGHKMGPLATADLIGLDIVLCSLEVLRDSLDDRRYEPAPLLRSMVEEGRLGRKRGRGFFLYEPVPHEAPTSSRD
jgi:3-hydroxybutyryl-CoA dehydrogenase